MREIELDSGEGKESGFESKWFLIVRNEHDQIINVELKDNEIKLIFKEIRDKFERCLQQTNDLLSKKIVSGQYGNAISSLKRSIMQEFVVVVTGCFLHYFDIDTTYSTAKSVIKGLFGLSIKREVILSSFSTSGRSASVKSDWFSVAAEGGTIFYDAFRLFFAPEEQYKRIKNSLDEIVLSTK